MKQIGLQSILTIMSHVLFIWLAFMAVQSVDWERILHKRAENFGKVLIVFVAISLGYLVSSCFINVLQSFQNLIFMF